jgi:hypothetical protein
VEEQLLPGHEDLIAALKFDGKTTGEQAAVKVLQAERSATAKALADFRADGQSINVANPAPPLVDGKPKEAADDSTPEQKAVKEWESSKELRAEFGDDKVSYMAYAKASAAGLVHILKGGKE